MHKLGKTIENGGGGGGVRYIKNYTCQFGGGGGGGGGGAAGYNVYTNLYLSANRCFLSNGLKRKGAI